MDKTKNCEFLHSISSGKHCTYRALKIFVSEGSLFSVSVAERTLIRNGKFQAKTVFDETMLGYMTAACH